MRALHDKIMVDMYYQAKKANTIESKTGRLVLTFFVVSGFDGINFMIIVLWLKSFTMQLGFQPIPYNIHIDLFPGTMLNGATSGIILFYLPFFILNFFAIFYKKRYDKLLEKYEYRNGKLMLAYLLITFGVAVIPMGLAIFVF